MFGEDKTSKIALYTCDPFKLVTSIPQLVEEGFVTLRMKAKVAKEKFEAYMNNVLIQ